MTFEEFKGQTIFITGAASGIGQAQALAFIENGANVFGFDQDEVGLQRLSERYPKQFAYHIGSVKSKADVEKAVRKAIDSFKYIDILLNTAGVLDEFKATLETDEMLWDHILDTNVKGTYFVTNAILPLMLTQKKGVVVNMASIAGLVAGVVVRLIRHRNMQSLATQSNLIMIIARKVFAQMRLHRGQLKRR